MLQKIINSIVRKRHPWRTMKFDELAEVYTSMSLRSLGFSLIGIFVPVYLFDKGESLPTIFALYGLFFVLRAPVAFVAGFVVGRIGPKHSIALSNVIFIVFLSLLLSYEAINVPLTLVITFFTAANGLFFVAYNTDFSKIKHQDHGGKELGWLFIFERVGGALGPIVGGLLAAIFVPEATIVFAILVLVGSLIPLFVTNEPVRLHQHITYKSFPHKRHVRDFVSLGTFNILNVANGVAWPLLMAVFIFTEHTYAKLGLVVGFSLAISIFSAHMFGKFIDSKKGESLLLFGTWMNAALSIIRSLITGFGGALAASTLGEPISLAYRMPITKGYYDAADSEEGYRIVYLVLGEIWSGLAKSLYFYALWAFSQFYDPIIVLRASFIAVAMIGFVMLTQRFPALKKV